MISEHRSAKLDEEGKIMTHPTHAQSKPVTPHAQSATKAEARPEVKPETKPETRATETKATEAKTEAKTVLPDDFMASGVILPAELAAVAAPRAPRSDKQLSVDKTVARLHKIWVDAERPTQNWTKLVEAKCVTTYFIEPDKTPELHKLVNRACELAKVRVRWGTSFLADKDMVGKYNLPAEYVGREVVSFAIVDKRPRTDKSAVDESKASGEARK